MTIYVLVEVTYDYYRFQENISASITGKFDKFLFNGKYPILDYEIDSKEYVALDGEERCHYWIQKFEMEE